MIPSYFKIEILAIQDEFVLLGRKGLIGFELSHIQHEIAIRNSPSSDFLIPFLDINKGC